jgi:hypothetical protein
VDRVAGLEHLSYAPPLHRPFPPGLGSSSILSRPPIRGCSLMRLLPHPLLSIPCLLLTPALLPAALGQGSDAAIFLGSSTSGSTDSWWLIDPVGGVLTTFGGEFETNNCSGTAFTRGGQDLLIMSSLNGTCSVADATGSSPIFSELGMMVGNPYGLEVDPFHQRYMTMLNTGSGFELQILDGNPNSVSHGQVIAATTSISALGGTERWGMSPFGNHVVGAPILFTETAILVDTDPDSPTYLQASETPPTTGIPGLAIGIAVEISEDDNIATILLAGFSETLAVRYDLEAGSWVDTDPLMPGDQHISIPYPLGTNIELLPGGREAIVCGTNFVGRLDFGFTPDAWTFTEFSPGMGLFDTADALSVSPDGSQSFVSAMNPDRGLIIDNQTGVVVHSIPLPGTVGCGCMIHSAWRGPMTEGDLYCSPAIPNSTGQGTTLATSDASGPTLFHLEATNGPPNEFGFFLVAAGVQAPGFLVGQGVLCLSLPVGRYNANAGPSFNSLGQFDAAGVLQNLLGTSTSGSGFDIPTALPNPPGGSITPGTTWAFQLWHRDAPATSNFSDALVVAFY